MYGFDAAFVSRHQFTWPQEQSAGAGRSTFPHFFFCGDRVPSRRAVKTNKQHNAERHSSVFQVLPPDGVCLQRGGMQARLTTVCRVAFSHGPASFGKVDLFCLFFCYSGSAGRVNFFRSEGLFPEPVLHFEAQVMLWRCERSHKISDSNAEADSQVQALSFS